MLPKVLLCLWVFCGISAAQQRLDLSEGEICKQSGGKTWTCKEVRSCPKAIQDLQQKRRPQLCRFTDSPVVCCEPSGGSNPPPPPPQPPQPPPTSGAGAKSKQKCTEYAEAVFIKTLDFLGTNVVRFDTCAVVEPLITKGENAVSREFPHMALIGYGKKESIEWLCGGSLISERFVLSAAHCTDSGSSGLARWVRLGDYNIATKADETEGLAKAVDYEIVQRIDHPDYRSPSVYNDITLYRLDRPVEFSEFIRPACLHTPDQPLRENAIATGWGRTEWGGRGSDILQKVKLAISSADQCRTDYRLAIGPKLRDGIRDVSQFCAGDLTNRGDTCQGDSGGPFQVSLKTPYCMYSQVGVTSFGVKCGGNKPGVYTRVSHFVPWIESIVWP